MANKALKSIKFPGLNDTYTIPQVDNTLAVSGAAADAKKTGDQLNDLKSAFNVIDEVNYTLPSSDIIQGSYSNSSTAPGKWVDNSKRIRNSGFIHVLPGYSFHFVPGTNAAELLWGKFANGSLVADSSWITEETTIAIPSGTYAIVLVFAKSGRNTDILPSDYDATVTIYSKTANDIDGTANSIDDLADDFYDVCEKQGRNLVDPDKLTTGALTSSGTLTTDGSYANYVTSDFIRLEPNTNYTFTLWNSSNGAILQSRKIYLLFDVNKTADPATFKNQTSENSLTFNSGTHRYVRVTYENDISGMLEKGSTYTTWEAYKGYWISDAYLGDGPLAQAKKASSELYGKKWVPLGDSFTNYTNKDIEGGTFNGQDATYPRLIADRCGMNLVQTFFRDGRTLAFPATPGEFTNSLTCTTADWYYQNIPADVDYITFYIGINDEHHYTGGGDGEDQTGLITLGTIDDNTTATYYGAWNVVLSWLIANRPNAHIGIIVTNGLSIPEWRQAQIDIAKKYGIAYIDMNGNERTPAMLRTVNSDIAASVKSALITKWAVDPTGAGGSINTHPNWQAHEYESTFIESFIKSL